jgi:hypothetical protein
MLAPTLEAGTVPSAHPSTALLPSELEFYECYGWCLDPHLSVRDAMFHLRDEIDRLAIPLATWQIREVATNIYLLACAVLNVVDEHLRGPSLRLPRRLAATSLGRRATSTTDALLALRRLRLSRVRRWRNRWLDAVDAYLACFIQHPAASPAALARAAAALASESRTPPPDLDAEPIGVPSPFRRLDLTHHDVVALGERLIVRFPGRSQPLLLVGLRTSGSYFAPLLRAFLEAKGYSNVAFATMQPDKGPGRRERQDLRRRARAGYIAVILDDPPHSGGAVLRALEIARNTGFAPTYTVALVPVHPARPNSFGSLAGRLVIALPPEQWHKNCLLVPDSVQARLAEYLQHNGPGAVQVLSSPRTMDFEARLQALSLDSRGGRLKRIYEVRLQAHGAEETRFVLAKSVGWGWLGYHAFIAGHRLSGRVPEILGLRDGILYMEWYPQDKSRAPDRAALLDASADYIAARACRLRMHDGHGAASHPLRHLNAVTLLAKSLSKAHGPLVTGHLLRPRIEQRLLALPCPYPTLIDGKMETEEWIDGPNGPLKTDFEHHGMGKGELNTAETAFDLAQAILGLEADEAEEATLIQRYIAASGDVNVEQRLFLNKLLAGIWTINTVRNQIFDEMQGSTKQQRLHRRYMTAWNFLTIQAARACGALCVPSAAPAWRAPLWALDVDGVIDNRIFGFPCTTAAGIQALSLLRAHGFTAILNTARSAAEVKAYCRAYSLAGGIAEYGSCLWDAVSGQEHTLISAEAIAQLQKLRLRLRQIPGVFLDERHRHSIRAFTYQEAPRGLLASVRSTGSATAPVPALLMTDLVTEPGLDLLSFQQTTIDTTVIARGTDKGTALIVLRDRVLGPDSEIIAVGDSEPDLPMFQAATQAFAPAHIGCACQARLLGCNIVDAPRQRGLLKIARAVVHPDRRYCPSCAAAEIDDANRQTLWFDLLQAADGPAASNFLRALRGQGSIRALLR